MRDQNQPPGHYIAAAIEELQATQEMDDASEDARQTFVMALARDLWKADEREERQSKFSGLTANPGTF